MAKQLTADNAPWVLTRTGAHFRPTAPRPEAITLEDIAAGLARRYRWGGQTRIAYTVAQHCEDVAAALPPRLKLWGLLHDAAEAWTFDAQRPIKSKIYMFCPWGRGEALVALEEIERRILAAVAERFSLPWPIPAEVWAADDRALATEARDLGVDPEAAITVPAVEPFPAKLQPLPEAAAFKSFLATGRMLLSYQATQKAR